MKTYLGDSVYAEYLEDGVLKLTTENELGSSNRIYLEPEVLAALMQFVMPEREHDEDQPWREDREEDREE